MIIVLGTIGLLFLYGCLMVWLSLGVYKMTSKENPLVPASTRFSICIPFRNEQEHLPDLLASLVELNYPRNLMEIIFIDDGSEDHSYEICQQFIAQHVDLICSLLKNDNNSTSPKKTALKKAISTARYEYIVTTDADCVVPKNWLQHFNALITTQNPRFIAGPVSYFKSSLFLDKFQALDFLSLQAVTLGSFGMNHPLMCNGANLCYEKKAYTSVNGFSGNEQFASGDDVFLLQKMQQNKYRVDYLAQSDAIVKTIAQKKLKGLLNQRVRWAAKTKAYTQLLPKAIGLVVFIVNLLILVLGIGIFMIPSLWKLAIFGFIFKGIIDFILLYKIARFFNETTLLNSYFLSAICYPFFSVFVSLKATFTGYTWKGRKFKK